VAAGDGAVVLSPAAKEAARLERVERLVRQSEEENPLRVEPLGQDRRCNRYYLLNLHGMPRKRLVVEGDGGGLFPLSLSLPVSPLSLSVWMRMRGQRNGARTDALSPDQSCERAKVRRVGSEHEAVVEDSPSLQADRWPCASRDSPPPLTTAVSTTALCSCSPPLPETCPNSRVRSSVMSPTTVSSPLTAPLAPSLQERGARWPPRRS
jgi:hypothetical protein